MVETKLQDEGARNTMAPQDIATAEISTITEVESGEHAQYNHETQFSILWTASNIHAKIS